MRRERHLHLDKRNLPFQNHNVYQKFNPFKPSVPFVGHRQTMQIKIRRHRMWRLIRISTVCLQNVLLKFQLKIRKNTQQPLHWKWTRLTDK